MVFGQTKVTKGEFYSAKKLIKIWNVNFDNIVVSKLIKTKNYSKYLIGYLDWVIRPLVLILLKISWFVKIIKVKDGNKDKKLMFSLFKW